MLTRLDGAARPKATQALTVYADILFFFMPRVLLTLPVTVNVMNAIQIHAVKTA